MFIIDISGWKLMLIFIDTEYSFIYLRRNLGIVNLKNSNIISFIYYLTLQYVWLYERSYKLWLYIIYVH